MRRDAGGHAHGDTGATVQEKERQLGRKDRWFLLGPVEVGGKINCVIAYLIEKALMGDGSQPRFGVTHGCRWVIVHRSEVAMAIQEWMAAREGLNQAHQGVVDRLVTMGVILAQHVTHHAGAFAIGAVWGEPQFMHRKQDAALHGFETVTGIRKRPTHDHAHRVFEVGALHLLMQGDRLNALLCHPCLELPRPNGAQPTDVFLFEQPCLRTAGGIRIGLGTFNRRFKPGVGQQISGGEAQAETPELLLLMIRQNVVGILF